MRKFKNNTEKVLEYAAYISCMIGTVISGIQNGFTPEFYILICILIRIGRL